MRINFSPLFHPTKSAIWQRTHGHHKIKDSVGYKLSLEQLCLSLLSSPERVGNQASHPRELYMAGVTTRGRARVTRRITPNLGRYSFRAFGEGGERGEYPCGAIVAARAGGIFVYLALKAKQFKFKVTSRAKIFVNGHFQSFSFLKALKNTLGT